MGIRDSLPRKMFIVLNTSLLAFFALICLLPVINVLAISLSDTKMADAGLVGLWPLDFNTSSYKYVFAKPDFLDATLVSLKRVVLGYFVNMLLTLLTAYPLSKTVNQLKWRTGYCWFFVITMLFSGGLIPLYMLVMTLNLRNTIFALVLPGAVPVFNVILLINFFRQIPSDYADAACIDGAGHWMTLFRVYVPLSVPVLATLSLFTVVGHWNSWFDGIIYMNKPKLYPLQSYLQTVVINVSDMSRVNDLEHMKEYAAVSDKTVKAARLFLGALPVMLVYIPLQKYFIKGITLGGIKG